MAGMTMGDLADLWILENVADLTVADLVEIWRRADERRE